MAPQPKTVFADDQSLTALIQTRMPNIKVFSGSSHRGLTEKIGERLQIDVSKAALKKFSNRVSLKAA